MRRLPVVTLAAALTLGPLLLPTVSQAATPPAQEPASEPRDHRLFAVGAGAIVGIVAFNMLTYSFGSVPFVAGALAATPVDVALGSRLLATITGGVGALAAHYWYTAGSDKPMPAQ